VLLRAKGEGVHVDTGVRAAGVVLEGLDGVEVRSLTLREAVLTVKLKLGNNHRVLAPAVHVKGGLGKHEGTGVRDGGTNIRVAGRLSELERLTSGGVGIIVFNDRFKRKDASESLEGRRKDVNSVGVVESLGTLGNEKILSVVIQRGTVVNVSIRLGNPHKLLTGVVEVELDLVGRGTNRLVTSELELLNQVLVGVLGHSAALIGIKEDVINVKGGGNKGLAVLFGILAVTIHSPQALIKRTEIKVDLHLVVLKSDQRKGKSGVAAEPELKRHVKGGLRESLARSAHLRSGTGITRRVDIGVFVINGVSQSGGVANHLVVTSLLVSRHGELGPDVHPVAILTVDALTTDLNLHLGDELMTREVQPTSLLAIFSDSHLRKSHLKVSLAGKITVTAHGTGHTTTEIGLTVESLFDRFHRKVSVSAVSHLPESDLRITSEIDVLSAISYELH
jgi:hypothetical protein